MPSTASVPSLPQAPLDSSSLHSVGYSAEAGTMEIAFHNGAIYRYFDVPPHIHQGLLSASSKGQYFNAVIRSGFRFERRDPHPSDSPPTRTHHPRGPARRPTTT